MGTLVVLALVVVLAVCGLTGLWVADSRDGRDWRAGDWPSRRG
ncbi:hypothetical protein [Actinomadura kijaniata]|nr:hypothetical protein [Actinomadura kijaniata]